VVQVRHEGEEEEDEEGDGQRMAYSNEHNAALTHRPGRTGRVALRFAIDLFFLVQLFDSDEPVAADQW
jgi:hypothetical protein